MPSPKGILDPIRHIISTKNGSQNVVQPHVFPHVIASPVVCHYAGATCLPLSVGHEHLLMLYIYTHAHTEFTPPTASPPTKHATSCLSIFITIVFRVCRASLSSASATWPYRRRRVTFAAIIATEKKQRIIGAVGNTNYY